MYQADTQLHVLAPLLLVVSLLVVSRASASLFHRISPQLRGPTLRYGLGSLYTLAVAGVIGCQMLFAPGEALLEIAISEPVSDELTALANGLLAGGTAVTGVLAVSHGSASIRSEICGWCDTVDERLRRRQQVAFAVLIGGIAIAFEVLRADVTPIGVEWTVPVGLTLGSLYLYFSHQVFVPARTTRHPDPAERERIERWYDDVDELPANIIVFSDATRPASVIAGGRGETRWLWVRERILEKGDDETLGVALTQAEAKRRNHFWPLFVIRTLFGCWSFSVLLALLLLIFSGPSRPPAMAIVALTASIALSGAVTWLIRRVSYRADDEVTATFGADRVVGAYRQIGDLDFVPSVPSALEPLDPEPDTGKRLGRLCDRHSIERPTASPDDTQSSTAELDAVIPPVTWPTLIGICTASWGIFLTDFISQWWFLDPGPTVVLIAALTVAFPLAVYIDALRTRSVSGWPNHPAIVALLSAIWFFNFLVGCWYLWKRRRVSSELAATPSEQ